MFTHVGVGLCKILLNKIPNSGGINITQQKVRGSADVGLPEVQM